MLGLLYDDSRRELVETLTRVQHKPIPSWLSPYFLLNSPLEAKLFSFLRPFWEINNILNEDYRIYVDVLGGAAGVYTLPGRNLTLGF